MTLTNKVLIFFGATIILGLLGFIVYKQVEISSRQQAIEEQVVKQKDLVDGIVRSQNEYATKGDIAQFIKDNGIDLKAVQTDLNKLHAEVAAVNVVSVGSSGQTGNNISSSGTGAKNPNPTTQTDPFGYQKTTQLLTLNEDFTSPDNGTKVLPVPFGTVGFSAWQERPWSVNILPREYHVSNIVGTDENQRTYFYNRFSVKVDNKEYDVKIASAETKQEYPTAKFSWFNPRLFLTTGGAVNISNAPVSGDFNVGLTMQIMSYGQFLTTPAISVLQVGAGYEINQKAPALIINPVNFNVGRILPKGLMDSTYIGPSFQLSTKGSIFMGLNLSVGL